MNVLLRNALCAVTALTFVVASANADLAPAGTAKVVTAANAFLATLDAKQKASVIFPFDDEKQRARWSNLPTGMVPRAGLSLKQLSEPQRSAAMALVATVLSQRGYEKVQQIMDGDEVLKTQPNNGPGGGGGPGGGRRGNGPRGGGPTSQPNGGPPGGGPGGPGGPGGGRPGGGGGPMFGKDNYYISILGTPSDKDPWMLQFGGHHLALNISIIGERGILTPTLTAAQPATYTLNGKTVRPLGQENDKAFALLAALDEGQRKQAVLNYHVGDLVLGPGHDGETIQPEGLKVSAMTEAQRAMLLDLIGEWSLIVNDGYAATRTDDIKAGLADTWFAWSGPTSVEPGKNGTSYYRIQGPKLVIEYAPQRSDDHIHTMYRDPTNDYGRAAKAK